MYSSKYIFRQLSLVLSVFLLVNWQLYNVQLFEAHSHSLTGSFWLNPFILSTKPCSVAEKEYLYWAMLAGYTSSITCCSYRFKYRSSSAALVRVHKILLNYNDNKLWGIFLYQAGKNTYRNTTLKLRNR